MRGLRSVVLVVSLVVVVAAGVTLGPTLLFKFAGRGSDDSKRRARAQIEQHVGAYATQVVGASNGPAGPSVVDLDNLAGRASLRYAPERTSGALAAIWVQARARAGGLFGTFDVQECYLIRFSRLGAAGADSQITHLSDCTAAIERILARERVPHPTSS